MILHIFLISHSGKMILLLLSIVALQFLVRFVLQSSSKRRLLKTKKEFETHLKACEKFLIFEREDSKHIETPLIGWFHIELYIHIFNPRLAVYVSDPQKDHSYVFVVNPKDVEKQQYDLRRVKSDSDLEASEKEYFIQLIRTNWD